MSADDDVAALVHLLDGYLRDNPLACDTAEGIARWWLAPAAPVDMAILTRALGRMRATGAIDELRAADGRVRYRRRPAAPPQESPPDGAGRDGDRKPPDRTTH